MNLIRHLLPALVATMFCHTGFAQDYPAKASRVIVTVLPGGGSDLLARLISQRMGELLGRPYVVEYRPGADSAIGLEAIAKAPADGYTFGVATSGLSIHQALSSKKRPFDANKDFAPIVLLATTTTVLAGKAALPPDNLNQLITYAKGRAQRITFASCSNGSSQHVAGELFAQLAGIQLTHVPFKGCTQGIPLVLNGEVDMIVNTLANLSPYIKAGKLKPYAVTGSQRSQFAPDLPTLAELGLTGGAMDNWFGLIGPAGMPQPIVARINREANAALTHPEGREKLIALQYDLRGGTPTDFANHIKNEIDRFSRIKGISIGDE
ncbi:MAG: Bug family tripartite tricarboxylate transporter substrate binding protein [Burkholderiales bacterium]